MEVYYPTGNIEIPNAAAVVRRDSRQGATSRWMEPQSLRENCIQDRKALHGLIREPSLHSPRSPDLFAQLLLPFGVTAQFIQGISDRVSSCVGSGKDEVRYLDTDFRVCEGLYAGSRIACQHLSQQGPLV